MARINGQLLVCERCGAQVFRKAVGEGEADGGYTRWNTFEAAPEGWRSVSVPEAAKQEYNQMLVCPECSSLWDRVLMEHFINTIKKEETNNV